MEAFFLDENNKSFEYGSEQETNPAPEPVNNPTEPQKKTSVKAEVYDWLQSIVTAILACILLFVFAVRTIGVIGVSMENTLHWKDRVVISNLFYSPKQGDIIVLRKETFREEPVIKRVIATEGQTIEIDFNNGIVYVDGEALVEEYIAEPTYRALDFTGAVTVPEGHVFVMGDNRNHSNDSRDSMLGVVDERYILGKTLFRIWPLSGLGKVD